MKYRTTKREIMNNYDNVISCSYCGLQRLLSCANPESYTCGVYGWNADIYKVDCNTVIVTGYRPFGRCSIDYDTSKRYERAAEEICKQYPFEITFEEMREKLAEKIAELAAEVTK